MYVCVSECPVLRQVYQSESPNEPYTSDLSPIPLCQTTVTTPMSRPTNPNRSTAVPPSSPSRQALGGQNSPGDLTKDLLRTYERVQAHIHELECENQRLRALLELSEATPSSKEVETQERAKHEPRTNETTGGGSVLEALPSPDDATSTMRDAETALGCLSSLFVASNWIHGALTLPGVHQRLRDILEQIVGAQAYAVYVADGATLAPIFADGLHQDEDVRVPPPLAAGVAQTGVSHITNPPSQPGSLQNPIAVIPLTVEQRLFGVLVIVRLLAHKDSLSDLDYEVFQLLGQHAATALIAAGLYAQAGQRLPTADAYQPAPQRG